MEEDSFPEPSGVGVKVVSEEGTKRLVRQAIDYAITHKKESGSWCIKEIS